MQGVLLEWQAIRNQLELIFILLHRYPLGPAFLKSNTQPSHFLRLEFWRAQKDSNLFKGSRSAPVTFRRVLQQFPLARFSVGSPRSPFQISARREFVRSFLTPRTVFSKSPPALTGHRSL